MYVLQFGDRLGSWIVLTLFGALFAMIAVGSWREIRRRAPESRTAALAVAALLFAGPMTLIYASSLGGFYEAEVRNGQLVLHYFLCTPSEMPLADVETIRAAPAFKGRWRLHIVRADGARYESATWNRDAVREAAEQLRTSVQKLR